MPRVIAVIALIALTVYTLIEVMQAERFQTRNAPRWLWFAIVLVAPLVGPVAWFVFGRPDGHREIPPQQRPGPRGPDDDPEFLRKLR